MCSHSPEGNILCPIKLWTVMISNWKHGIPFTTKTSQRPRVDGRYEISIQSSYGRVALSIYFCIGHALEKKRYTIYKYIMNILRNNLKRRTIAAACPYLSFRSIYFSQSYTVIFRYAGKTCSYGSYNGQNGKSNNTRVQVEVVLAHQRSSRRRLVCECACGFPWLFGEISRNDFRSR